MASNWPEESSAYESDVQYNIDSTSQYNTHLESTVNLEDISENDNEASTSFSQSSTSSHRLQRKQPKKLTMHSLAFPLIMLTYLYDKFNNEFEGSGPLIEAMHEISSEFNPVLSLHQKLRNDLDEIEVGKLTNQRFLDMLKSSEEYIKEMSPSLHMEIKNHEIHSENNQNNENNEIYQNNEIYGNNQIYEYNENNENYENYETGQNYGVYENNQDESNNITDYHEGNNEGIAQSEFDKTRLIRALKHYKCIVYWLGRYNEVQYADEKEKMKRKIKAVFYKIKAVDLDAYKLIRKKVKDLEYNLNREKYQSRDIMIKRERNKITSAVKEITNYRKIYQDILFYPYGSSTDDLENKLTESIETLKGLIPEFYHLCMKN